MNDKQQLAAMGEHLAEQQPLCMAKRIEELEAQVRVMAVLMRETLTYSEGPKWQSLIDDRKAHLFLGRIDAALAGNLPIQVTPEGWQLVPVEPTLEMSLAGIAAQAEKLKRYALGGSLHPIDHGMPDAYRAMLASAPKTEGK